MNQIVKLQVYEGKLAKNEDGTWITQNHYYKVRYGSKEWELLKTNGVKMFSKIEVVEVLEEKIIFGEKEVKGKKVPTQKHEYISIVIPQPIIDEVAEILKPKSEKTEKELIAELNAKIDALTSGNAVAPAIEAPAKPTAPPKSDEEGDETLEELQAKYEALTGKKPNQLWKERRLLTEIESLQNK
jgi:hypothetical protein